MTLDSNTFLPDHIIKMTDPLGFGRFTRMIEVQEAQFKTPYLNVPSAIIGDISDLEVIEDINRNYELVIIDKGLANMKTHLFMMSHQGSSKEDISLFIINDVSLSDSVATLDNIFIPSQPVILANKS